MRETVEPVDVLHVEDTPAFAQLTADGLAHADGSFVVEHVERVSDARTALSSGTFDCIVSDYDLCVRTGLDLLETVRESHPTLPFVLFTSVGSESVASEAISAGVTDYLQKSTSTAQFELLANRIHNAVDSYDARRAERRYTDGIEALHRTAGRLADATSDREVAQVAVDAATDILEFPVGGLFTPATPAGPLTPLAQTDRAERLFGDRPTLELDDSVAGQVFKSGQRRVCEDISAQAQAAPGSTPIGSEVILPLDDHGVLLVGDEDTDGVGETELSLLETLQTHVELALDRVDTRGLSGHGTAITERTVDALVDVFYVLDADGTLVQWNDRLNEVTGYTDGELAGMDATEFFRPADRAGVAERIAEAMSGQPVVHRDALVTADGETVPHEFRGVRVTDDDGTVTGVVGIARDIRERTQLEATVDRTTSEFDRLLDVSPVGIAVLDDEGAFRTANPRAMELLGFPDGALERQGSDITAWDAVDAYGEPIPAREHPVARTLEAGETVTGFEHGISHPDGTERWLSVSTAPIDADGTTDTGVIAFLRDITDRHEYEQALTCRDTGLAGDPAAHRELIQGLSTTSPEYTFVYSATGEYLDVVTGWSRRYDMYAPTDLVGQTVEDVFEPDIAETIRGHIGAALEDGGPEVFEYTLESGEDRRWYRAKVARLPEGYDGEPAVVLTASEITEQKRRQRAVKRRNERLSQFTSILSHDLRNPLQVALTRLDMAANDHDCPQHGQIKRVCERMTHIIDDALVLCQTDYTVEQPCEIDLAAVVRDAWDSVATGEATLELAATRQLSGDETLLRHLFENLFRNAVEHGGETVTVRVTADENGFAVGDDGCGLPDGAADEDLFETGFSTSVEGTGLGLDIVEKVATAHGWSVGVTDDPRGGAQFRVVGA